MTTYLRNYVGSVSELPGELARKFKLMRELDDKAQALQAEAEAAARQRLEVLARKAENASSSPTPKRSRTAQASAQSDAAASEATLQQIEAQMRQVLHYSEEKIGLSQQIYDYVDQKIQRLDKDLKNFEGDIARERSKLGLAEGEPASSLLPQEDNPADKGKGLRTQKKGGKPGAGRGQSKVKKMSLLGPTVLARGPGLVPLDIAEAKKGAVRDPAEPVYCYCQRVSFGEMVACDNPDCPIEWFHYECVGLDEPPKGKWYCRDCEELRKNGQLMED